MLDSQLDDLDAAIPARVRDCDVRDGIWKRQNASECRAFSGRLKGMPPVAAQEKAARLDAEADSILDITTHADKPTMIGAGGEVAGTSVASSAYVDTLLQCPDMVAVDASRQRLALVEKAGGLALALDAAETIQAANSLEKMVAHQIAVAHIAAVETQVEALALLREFANSDRRYAILTTEAARLMNSSARMMDVSQRGMITMNRLRNSGRQTMVVQHVHVSDGGQAVVAGQVKGRSRGGRAKCGG
jgi:hypothetical protein